MSHGLDEVVTRALEAEQRGRGAGPETRALYRVPGRHWGTRGQVLADSQAVHTGWGRAVVSKGPWEHLGGSRTSTATTQNHTQRTLGPWAVTELPTGIQPTLFGGS